MHILKMLGETIHVCIGLLTNSVKLRDSVLTTLFSKLSQTQQIEI